MKRVIRWLSVVVAGVLSASTHARRPRALLYLRRLSPPTKSRPASARSNSKDGAPTKETAAQVYDQIDFTHAYEAFVEHHVGRQHQRPPQGPCRASGSRTTKSSSSPS